jgi:hypothetical protein
LILPISQKLNVTTGLICAPLSFPTGEIAIRAPVEPNRKPVINLLNPSSGKICAAWDPYPNIRMTIDKPTNTNIAVPTSSDKNGCQGSFLIFIF